MALISEEDRQFLREKFAVELKQTVHISFYTQPASKLLVPGRVERQYCQVTEELLKEVAALSDKILLRVVDITAEPEETASAKVEMVPAILMGKNGSGNVRYFGIPAGNEFPNFIQDLVHLSQGDSPLSQRARELVNRIDEDVRISVFVTPT